MKRNKYRASAFGRSLMFSVIIGILSAMFINLLLTALLTNLILRGYLGNDCVVGMMFLTRAISSFVGTLIAGAILKENYLKLAGLISGGLFFVLTGLGILIYDGNFTNVVLGAISLILGGGLAFIIFCFSKVKGRKHPKIKI